MLVKVTLIVIFNVNELQTKILFDNGRLKKPKRLSLASRRAIITQIGSVEQGYYKACTSVICKKLYGLVHFLQSYDVN